MKGWLDKYKEGGEKKAKVNLEDVYTKLGISAKNFIDPMSGAAASSDATRTIKPAEAKRFEIRRDQLNPTGYKNEQLSKFYKDKDAKKKAVQKAGETFQTIGAFAEPLALIPTPITETIGVIGGIANALGSSVLATNDISEGNYLDAFGNLAIGATSVPALGFANPSNIRSLARNLPKARSFNEGLGAAFANITPAATLPRMSAQELKTARGVQDIGRLRATGAPKSKQIQKALDLNLSEDQFVRSFGMSREEATNSLANPVPVPTVTNQVRSDNDRDLFNALFGRRSTTAERDRINQVFQESESFPELSTYEDSSPLASDLDIDSTNYEMPQSLRDRIANVTNRRTESTLSESDSINQRIQEVVPPDIYAEQRNRLADARERIANLRIREEQANAYPRYSYSDQMIDQMNQQMDSSSSNFNLLSSREKLQKSIEDATRNFIHPYKSYSGPISDKLGYLVMDKSGKQGARNAVQRALENVQKYSSKGEVITGSLNTSHSSYLPQLKTIFGEAKNLGNPVFLGNEKMNMMGFLSKFGYPPEDIARYMNTEIDELVKRGKLPNDIMRPTYMPELNSVQLPHYGIQKTTESSLDKTLRQPPPFNPTDLPFKNGGELNYNDYSISAPEGYVGDGTFNKGRDYSPAWGGQFQNGGELPNVTVKGKKKQPIYVTDKNDPRLRAYQDSLSLYNESKNTEAKLAKILANAYKRTGFDKSTITKALNEGKDIVLHPEKYVEKGSFGYIKKYNKKGLYYESFPDEEYLGTPESPATIKDLIKYNKEDIKERTPYLNSLDEDINGLTSRERIESAKIVNASLQKQYDIMKRTGYNPTYFIPNAERSPNLIFKKPTQPVIYQERTYQTETPELQDLAMGLPVNVSLPELQRQAGPNRITMGRPLFKGGPQTDYYTPIDEAGNVINTPEFKTSQFEDGGPVKRFMQPTETFKNFGYNPKEKGLSTEYSTSIGGPGEVYLVPGYRQGRLLNDPEATFNMYGEHLGGPFKTVQAAEDFAQLRHKYVEQNKNLPAPFKTRDYAMGGSIPGAVGFTYARTQSPAPSNGKYAKKTMASAQNGMEMRYYQNGLDFEPKGMGKNGKVIKDDMGQWAHPGEITQIDSNQITMQGVPYPVLGISDTGDMQMMYPNQDYTYEGSSVTEYPMAQEGMTVSSALDMLDYPQKKMMQGLTGKEQKPSDWIKGKGYFNQGTYRDKGMLLAADVIADPLNFIPVSKLKYLRGLKGEFIPDALNTLRKIYNTTRTGTQYADNASDVSGAFKQGGQLTKLDQLTNFTNYNTKQPGGWLDKYQ